MSQLGGGGLRPLGHLDGARVPPPAPGLDAGGLDGRGPDGDGVPAADEELEDLGVDQALDWFTVNVGHQVIGPQSRIVGRRSLVHIHHQVVDDEDVRVTKVNTNVLQVEPKTSWTSTDDNWRLEAVDQR